MKSLVVLFSVMALVATKPSLPVAFSYAAPGLALESASVSHQSRIDIKSSPAVIKSEIISPAVARTFVAETPIVSAPWAYATPIAAAPAAVSTQSRIDIKSSPAFEKTEIIAPAVERTFVAKSSIVSAPWAYDAPIVAAPAAVSTQSRIDIKSSPAFEKTEIIAPAVERTFVAKSPIVSAPWTYDAPIVAAPAAVSTQSRIDIKSSPAVVKSEIITPAVERTYVAKPPIVSAPWSYAAPIAAAAPPAVERTFVAKSPIVSVPHSYAAPIVAAPAAVSTQSRIDIKSSPAIVSASPLSYNSPLAFGTSLTYSAPIATSYTSSILAAGNTPVIAPALLKTAAIAPVAVSAPAKIESNEPALPIAPTETPEVAAARAAHLEAKRLEEFHHTQKRSVGIVAASPVVSSYAAPIVSSYAASPVVYSPPITRIGAVALQSPILTSTYGIHPY